jgi:MoaA/NifB/PqqE/SkfB family radical SAM enzyme/Tfp pilus assembly protein PilF
MASHSCDYNQAKIQASIQRRDIFLDGLPLTIHFLMIDKCNVKCIMCGGDYFRSTSGKMITLEKFKTMAANLKLENARAVVLAGAGDPLLNRDLVEIVRFINSRHPHIAISITTNGLSLTESLSRSLLACNIQQVNISINSATRETYQRIMQIDGFDSVCRQAKTFDDLRRSAGRRVSLQFSAAINRLNIEEMPRLVELAKQIGVDSINLFYTRFYPERIRHMNVETPSCRLQDDASLFFHQSLSDDMLEQTKSLARQYGIRLNHEPLFKEQAPPGSCTWPMTQIMVGFDGEIYPCGGAEIHFRDKVERGIYDFGNALEGPVDHFWNSEIYRALRISSRQGESCPIAECKCCANVTSPNDLGSHIMQWEMDDIAEPLNRGNEQLPLVSVIVPTYNRPDQLKDAIGSIQSQTYKNIEILVVNDNGVDVGERLASMNTGGRITYIRHSRNRGLAAARNTGIRSSKGKYIAYLDDDDIFYPEHIQTLVGFLEKNQSSVAYTDAYRAWQRLENGRCVTFKKDVPYSFEFDYDRILGENFVPVLCFMHRRDCLDQSGIFDENLRSHEDWDLWIRMSRKFEFKHIKQITCEFAHRSDGTTMSSGNKADMRITCEKIFEKYQELTMNKPDVKLRQGRMRSGLRAAEALDLARHGKIAQGIDLMTECLKFDPDNSQTHSVLGMLFRQGGDSRRAALCFEQAAALSRTPAGNQDNQNGIEGFGDKEPDLKQTVSSGEKVADILQRGKTQMSEGQFQAACQSLMKVLDLSPSNIDAVYLLGVIAFETQMVDSALFFFRQVLQIDINHGPAWQDAVERLAQLERHDAAADALGMHS